MSSVDPIPALKRQLGAELAALLAHWNADDVAVLIGTDRPRISELRRGKLGRFSLETLIRYVTRLRHRVELNVVAEPRPTRNGERPVSDR
jgi:predicted XRE-type DNA-binding protein